MSAGCIKCGGTRAQFDAICPACGLRPEGEGLLLAWLLSTENLKEEELEVVTARIKAGEPFRPSSRMLAKAKRALGQHFSTDEGLSTGQRLAVLATSLLLTPLPGLVLFVWWRQERPRASLQALLLSAPASVLFFFGVLTAGLWG